MHFLIICKIKDCCPHLMKYYTLYDIKYLKSVPGITGILGGGDSS